MIMHIPNPNGDPTFGYIPEELHGFVKCIKPE